MLVNHQHESTEPELLNTTTQGESTAVHAQRVAEAKQARIDAEAELRMLFYLDALDPGVEEVLATYDFHAALARASMQVCAMTVFCPVHTYYCPVGASFHYWVHWGIFPLLGALGHYSTIGCIGASFHYWVQLGHRSAIGCSWGMHHDIQIAFD